MRLRATGLLAGAILAGCGAKAAPTDRCAAEVAAIGPEVPYQRYQRPAGCLPAILEEYTSPNGALGTKIFTIRSEESFQTRYRCQDPSGQPIPSGIDWATHRLVLSYRDHRSSERYQLLSVRSEGEGRRALLGYRIEQCVGGSGFTLDVEELLLPATGGPVASHRCTVETRAPCATE